MKRILFDTSVYGELILESMALKKIEEQFINNELIIYGNKIIRDELRETPKRIKLGNKSAKILLLQIYDTFICKENHSIKIGKVTEILSQEYYKAYKKVGGNLSFADIASDFLIVACASLKELDIVVSHDTLTMLSSKAINSYKKVNDENSLRNPHFITYKEYKKRLDFINSSA